MNRRKGRKLVTLTSLTLALAVSVTYGFSQERVFREYWQILRLRSPSPDTREEAARSLGDLKAMRATSHLVGRVRSDRERKVREAATLALGKLGPGVGEEAIQAVVESLKDYRLT